MNVRTPSWTLWSSASHGIRCLLLAGLVLPGATACSGEFHNAPSMSPARTTHATGCGSTGEIRSTLKASATREQVAPLGQLLRTRWVESGRYRQVVRLLLTVLREMPPTGLAPAVVGLGQGEGLAHLRPYLRAVVRYSINSPRLELQPGEEYARQEHLGPIRVLGATVQVCPPQPMLRLLQALLTVRIACPTCPGGERLVVAALADGLARVLADPNLDAVLDSVEFTDGETQQGTIGREAFALVMGSLVDGVASPSFNGRYFDETVRSLVQDVIGSRLGPAGQQDLEAFMDLVDLALAPELGLLSPLQDTVACMRRLDTNLEMAGFFFDFLRLQSLEADSVLTAVSSIQQSRDGAMLNDYLARVLGFLASDATLARDVMNSIHPLISNGAERDLLLTLDGLQGTGVLSGILEVMAAVLSHCQEPSTTGGG